MKVNSITVFAVATMFIRCVSTRLMLLLMVLMAPMPAFAQTGSFTYQGKLSDSGNPANGSYDLQFKLYDALTGGGQIGVRTRTDVPVTGGIFTVQLDFAVGAFSGLDRFLEIGVRPAGSPNPFTTLSPRQPITSAPYAFHSLSSEVADVATTSTNANQLGGVAANQYVLTTDARMTDARAPTAGSTSYIQNTTSPQASNFNVSGNGTAGGTLSGNAINAIMQYNIGGQRVLGAPGTSNFFAGIGTGSANTTGQGNSFFGVNSGASNTMGSFNSFYGTIAGSNNLAGNSNSFFGSNVGVSNSSGSFNSFFGDSAGFANTTASGNSFFGYQSGLANTGSLNSFFGTFAGKANTTGYANSFFGYNAGAANTTAINNSFFGQGAGFRNTTGHDNTFVGNGAGLSNLGGNSDAGSLNTFVGSLAGEANTAGFRNSFFGAFAGQNNITDSNFLTGGFNAFFGAYSGQTNTTGYSNSFFGDVAGTSNTTGVFNSFFGEGAGYANETGSNNSFFGGGAGNANTGSNNAFFGAQAGYGNLEANDNSFFGVTAGNSNTSGDKNSFFGRSAGAFGTMGANNSFFGYHAGLTNTTGDNNTVIGASADVGANNLHYATAIGAGAVVSTSNTIVLGRDDGSDFVRIAGLLTIPTLAAAGTDHLCLNSFARVGLCSSSSLRYKTNLVPYLSGLSIVNRLRPISFTWKEGGMRDLGFGAEDVEKVDPLLVIYNKQGQVEGVKYDRINVVLVNAVREQQGQIEKQQLQIKRQQTQLDRQRDQLELQRLQIEILKQLVCLGHSKANVCQ